MHLNASQLHIPVCILFQSDEWKLKNRGRNCIHNNINEAKSDIQQVSKNRSIKIINITSVQHNTLRVDIIIIIII